MFNLEDYGHVIGEKEISILVNCDERSTKINARNMLDGYLNTELKNEYNFINSIKVVYLRSHNDYLIQAADIISGILFKRVNRKKKFNDFLLKMFKSLEKVKIYSNKKHFDIEDL